MLLRIRFLMHQIPLVQDLQVHCAKCVLDTKSRSLHIRQAECYLHVHGHILLEDYVKVCNKTAVNTLSFTINKRCEYH